MALTPNEENLDEILIHELGIYRAVVLRLFLNMYPETSGDYEAVVTKINEFVAAEIPEKIIDEELRAAREQFNLSVNMKVGQVMDTLMQSEAMFAKKKK